MAARSRGGKKQPHARQVAERKAAASPIYGANSR